MEEAKALLAELQAARVEQQRALADAQKARETLEHARKEYEDARAAEKAGEDEMTRAAEMLARGLETLNVAEAEEQRKAALPDIVDSLVEYHANIGCYQCYLFLEGHKDGKKAPADWDVAKLSVRVAFPRVEVTYKRQDGVQVVWSTEIERNVDVSQCVVEDKGDHWYLRLPIRPSDKQPLGGFSSFTQVSPVELRPESYASVSCRGCQAQLIGGEEKPTSFEKVLPMPSANWMDMFDFWGAGIGAFEHIPRDDIHAQQRRVLVGESYVLMHAADLLPGVTVAESDSESAVAPGDNAKEESEWLPLTCAACSKRIGLQSVEQPNTVRLHKHLTSARRAADKENREQEEDVFGKYTIDSILSAKLLEMADSDGVFRFVLASSSENEAPPPSEVAVQPPPAPSSPVKLQLQLLSWETMIRQQHSNRFRRVLKVLYAPLQSTPAIPGILPSHQVALPPAMCQAIAQRLQVSSTLLPLSLRTFNRTNVGYLFA